MNLRNASAKFSAAILALAIGGTTLHAQDAASTNGSDANAVPALKESSAANTDLLSDSNSVPVAGAAHKNGSFGSVRIDHGVVQLDGSDNSPPLGFGKIIIALAAILSPFFLVFGLPLAIIATVFYFRHRRNKMVHETLRAMIEKGMPISSELVAQLGSQIGSIPNKQPSRTRHLLPGLILIGIGLALMIVTPHSLYAAGIRAGSWILLFVGIAFLIVWLVDRKQNGNYFQRVSVTKDGIHVTKANQDSSQQPPKM